MPIKKEHQPKRQVKSKDRVAKHGEVFTAQREVNDMLDMVKQETERIESRFLEPACGDGNFLAEVLQRKLAVVSKKYRRSPLDYEKFSVIAVSSIYGVDIQGDNVEDCRHRLFKIWNREYIKICKKEANDLCRESVRFILSRNILCGNVLTMQQVDGIPIVFSQWDLTIGTKIKRVDYRLDRMLEDVQNEKKNAKKKQRALFGKKQESDVIQESMFDDTENEEYVQAHDPELIREFPAVDYRMVQNYE